MRLSHRILEAIATVAVLGSVGATSALAAPSPYPSPNSVAQPAAGGAIAASSGSNCVATVPAAPTVDALPTTGQEWISSKTSMSCGSGATDVWAYLYIWVTFNGNGKLVELGPTMWYCSENCGSHPLTISIDWPANGYGFNGDVYITYATHAVLNMTWTGQEEPYIEASDVVDGTLWFP